MILSVGPWTIRSISAANWRRVALLGIVGVSVVNAGDAGQRMAENGFADFVLHAKARQHASAASPQIVQPPANNTGRVVKLPFSLAERKRANGEHERRSGKLGLRLDDVESNLRQL